MRRFVLRFLIFGVVFVVLNNIMFLAVALIFPGIAYFDSRGEWIRGGDVHPRVAIMGSSTAYYSLNPREISTVSGDRDGEIVNLAANARTPIESYFVYESMEEQLGSLEYVFYGVDEWIFSRLYFEHDPMLTVLWNARERLHFVVRGDRLVQAVFGGELRPIFRSLARRTASWRRSVGARDGAVKAPELYGASVLDRKPANFYDEVPDWFQRDVFSFSDLQFEYLSRLRKAVEKRGGRFVLLRMPRSSAWRRDFEENCNGIDREFQAKLSEYSLDGRTVGKDDVIPENDESRCFADRVHLNRAGQRIFSDEFGALLRRLRREDRGSIISDGAASPTAESTRAGS